MNPNASDKVGKTCNDNDSDDSTVTTSDQEPELVYETGIVTLTGIPMVGQTVSLERVVDEDAEVNSSDDENIFKDVVWVSDCTIKSLCHVF